MPADDDDAFELSAAAAGRRGKSPRKKSPRKTATKSPKTQKTVASRALTLKENLPDDFHDLSIDAILMQSETRRLEAALEQRLKENTKSTKSITMDDTYDLYDCSRLIHVDTNNLGFGMNDFGEVNPSENNNDDTTTNMTIGDFINFDANVEHTAGHKRTRSDMESAARGAADTNDTISEPRVLTDVTNMERLRKSGRKKVSLADEPTIIQERDELPSSQPAAAVSRQHETIHEENINQLERLIDEMGVPVVPPLFGETFMEESGAPPSADGTTGGTAAIDEELLINNQPPAAAEVATADARGEEEEEERRRQIPDIVATTRRTPKKPAKQTRPYICDESTQISIDVIKKRVNSKMTDEERNELVESNVSRTKHDYLHCDLFQQPLNQMRRRPGHVFTRREITAYAFYHLCAQNNVESTQPEGAHTYSYLIRAIRGGVEPEGDDEAASSMMATMTNSDSTETQSGTTGGAGVEVSELERRKHRAGRSELLEGTIGDEAARDASSIRATTVNPSAAADGQDLRRSTRHHVANESASDRPASQEAQVRMRLNYDETLVQAQEAPFDMNQLVDSAAPPPFESFAENLGTTTTMTTNLMPQSLNETENIVLEFVRQKTDNNESAVLQQLIRESDQKPKRLFAVKAMSAALSKYINKRLFVLEYFLGFLRLKFCSKKGLLAKKVLHTEEQEAFGSDIILNLVCK
jgi:hypothetical protein